MVTGMKGNRKGAAFAALALVFVAGLAAAPPASSERLASARVVPPPFVAAEPRAVVMIPQSEVYYVPDSAGNVFYYADAWYSLRGDRWYRAIGYDGPWNAVERSQVPAQVVQVPRDCRAVYRDAERIPYAQWKEHRERHLAPERAVTEEDKPVPRDDDGGEDDDDGRED